MTKNLDGVPNREVAAREIQEVVLPDVQTFSVLATSGPETSKEAFATLESRLFAAQGNNNLKGRKFYGIVQPDGRYRACLVLMPDDDAEQLSCEPYTIPGGKYAKTKIDNWPEHTSEIGPAFGSLSTKFQEDKTRPSIEFYRSHTELVIFQPIQ